MQVDCAVQVVSEVDRAIAAAAEEGLGTVGNYFRDLVEFTLGNKFHMGFELVALNPEEFHKAFSDLVGEYQAETVEKLILRTLLPDDCAQEQDESDFITVIRRIRNGKLKVSWNCKQAIPHVSSMGGITDEDVPRLFPAPTLRPDQDDERPLSDGKMNPEQDSRYSAIWQ